MKAILTEVQPSCTGKSRGSGDVMSITLHPVLTFPDASRLKLYDSPPDTRPTQHVRVTGHFVEWKLLT